VQGAVSPVNDAVVARHLGFRVSVIQDASCVWRARAHRLDNGDAFGSPSVADSADEAVAELVRWLLWQRDHTAALSSLQAAAAAYHRLAVQTFAGDSSAQRTDLQDALVSLDAARRTLDAVRERK
jgi:hypothetical protein